MPDLQPPRRSFDPAPILARLAAGAGACRTFPIRIARDGSWWHEGARITRPELVRLFASILHRTPDGGHWLVTPAEQGRIEVEDAPFTMVELAAAGAGRDRRLRFRTNLDAWVTAGPAHRLILRPDAEGDGVVPYIELERGLLARLLRPVFYELVELAAGEPAGEDGAIGVWSDGVWFSLGSPAG
jgi:hypothetical protein